jgi:hypothetical protein
MKTVLWSIGMFVLLIAIPLGAEAQFPTPKPRPVAAENVAQAAPPASPPVVVSAPTQAAATSSPWTQSDVLQWIWTALGTIITGLFGKQVVWPSQSKPAEFQPPRSVTDLLNKIGDPATRKAIDEHLLTIVQSGIPGGLLQAGASAVPGVGPILVQLEPGVRRMVEDILAKRAAP